MKDLLARATVGLHTMANEHFGIGINVGYCTSFVRECSNIIWRFEGVAQTVIWGEGVGEIVI